MNIRVGELSGSDATNALHQTIKAFNDSSERQSRQMLALTKVIAWLTAVMLIAVVAPIYIATKQQHPSQTTLTSQLPDLKIGGFYRYDGDGKFDEQTVVERGDLPE